MAALKDALVDILVTIFIVVAVALHLEWARWILLVYTALMVILKLAALTSRGLRNLTTAQSKGGAPVWLYHILYLINVLALALAEWWWLFAGWGAIWILSVLVERRS